MIGTRRGAVAALSIWVACTQAAIAGFAFTDYPALVTADRLHVDSGLCVHIFELLRARLLSAAQAAIHKHYQMSAAFPLLLRAGGDLSQNQSLKSGMKLISLAKLLPVCLLAHGSAHPFVPLLVGALLCPVMSSKLATPLTTSRKLAPCYRQQTASCDVIPLEFFVAAAPLRWQKARDIACHTEASLAELRSFRIRCAPPASCCHPT